MALRIRRRVSGAAGAPTSLVEGELAFNEVDGVLYYGSGVGNDLRSATEVVPVAAKDLANLYVTIGGTRQTLGALLTTMAAQIAAGGGTGGNPGGGGGNPGGAATTADSTLITVDSTLITADAA